VIDIFDAKTKQAIRHGFASDAMSDKWPQYEGSGLS
jgi:hypothetical protein